MHRRAYTLIEVLVVIAVFLLLAALGYAIVPRMFSGQRRLSAVDQVSQWLVTARQRAKRDGVPTGLRLLLETDDAGRVVLEDGSALERQQRLGRVQGVGAQAGAQAGGQDDRVHSLRPLCQVLSFCVLVRLCRSASLP